MWLPTVLVFTVAVMQLHYHPVSAQGSWESAVNVRLRRAAAIFLPAAATFIPAAANLLPVSRTYLPAPEPSSPLPQFYSPVANQQLPTSVTDYYDESCVNPDGLSGTCKNFKSCESLLQLFRYYGSGVNYFLQKSICGFNGREPRVCCPGEKTSVSSNIGINANNNNNNNNNQYGPLLAPQCGLSSPKNPLIYPLVVGGVPASLGAWPWLAVLGYKNPRNSNEPNWLCGGSLISKRHVLTAAHCVHGRNDLYLVRLGEHELDDKTKDGANPIDVGIQRFSIHPEYNPQIFRNDLAILKLRQDIEFTDYIRPICLPVTENLRQQTFVDSFPYVAGWGATFFTGPRSSTLQQVQVPIVSKEECIKSFQQFNNVTIDDRVTCGGYQQGGKGACQGDSGGPVMLKKDKYFYAIGVISYGYKCATPGIPGVFTRTTAFLDFILSLLN